MNYHSQTPLEADIRIFYTKIGDLKLPMNVYLPKNFETNKQYKTIIAIHGGSWHGQKETSPNWDGGWLGHTAKYYANLGFVGITFSYRDILFSKGTQVTDLLADCRCALSYIKESFSFVDKNHVIFIGESAGGHLALSLVMGLCNIKTPIVPEKILAYNPVTDCTTERWLHLAKSFKTLRAVSPICNIKPLPCKLLIMHGDCDEIVPIEDSRTFCKKLKEVGTDVSLMEISGAIHSFALFGYKSTDAEVCAIYEKADGFILTPSTF